MKSENKKAAAAVRRLLKRRRTRESSVEDPCVAYAKSHGWLVRKMNGLGFRDWPDRFFIPQPGGRKTRTRFWVEFKRVGEGPTEMQAKMHQSLRRRGELVYVIDNYKDFCDVFHAHHD